MTSFCWDIYNFVSLTIEILNEYACFIFSPDYLLVIDYVFFFQLVYMGGKLCICLFKPWWNFIFTLFLLLMQDDISSRFVMEEKSGSQTLVHRLWFKTNKKTWEAVNVDNQEGHQNEGQVADIIIAGFKIFQLLIETKNASAFKFLRVNCWEINQLTSKFQMIFLDKICKNI